MEPAFGVCAWVISSVDSSRVPSAVTPPRCCIANQRAMSWAVLITLPDPMYIDSISRNGSASPYAVTWPWSSPGSSGEVSTERVSVIPSGPKTCSSR